MWLLFEDLANLMSDFLIFFSMGVFSESLSVKGTFSSFHRIRSTRASLRDVILIKKDTFLYKCCSEYDTS